MELYIVALLLCVTIASGISLTVPQNVKEALIKVIVDEICRYLYD